VPDDAPRPNLSPLSIPCASSCKSHIRATREGRNPVPGRIAAPAAFTTEVSVSPRTDPPSRMGDVHGMGSSLPLLPTSNAWGSVIPPPTLSLPSLCKHPLHPDPIHRPPCGIGEGIGAIRWGPPDVPPPHRQCGAYSDPSESGHEIVVLPSMFSGLPPPPVKCHSAFFSTLTSAGIHTIPIRPFALT